MPRKRKPRYFDVTVRIGRRDGRSVSREQARAALWAAHKLAQRGEPAEALRDWWIEAIDWRVKNEADGEPVRRYIYPNSASSAWEALGAMGGILETIGMKNLRVEAPRGDAG